MRKFVCAIGAGLLALCLSAPQVQANVLIGGTRVVFPAKDGEVTVRLKSQQARISKTFRQALCLLERSCWIVCHTDNECRCGLRRIADRAAIGVMVSNRPKRVHEIRISARETEMREIRV